MGALLCVAVYPPARSRNPAQKPTSNWRKTLLLFLKTLDQSDLWQTAATLSSCLPVRAHQSAFRHVSHLRCPHTLLSLRTTDNSSHLLDVASDAAATAQGRRGLFPLGNTIAVDAAATTHIPHWQNTVQAPPDAASARRRGKVMSHRRLPGTAALK